MRQLLFIALFVTTCSFARAQEYFRLDYADHWIAFDEDDGKFVPVINKGGEYQTVHFF